MSPSDLLELIDLASVGGDEALGKKLREEARQSMVQLAQAFPPDRCLACASTEAARLRVVEFTWRKQVGRSRTHHVRVTHQSVHPLCDACRQILARRRRWFWPLRYVAGIAFALAICGLVTCSILLYFLQMNRSEQTEVIGVLVASAVLLPIALIISRVSRSHSVPAPLMSMTGRGWECRAAREVIDSERAGE